MKLLIILLTVWFCSMEVVYASWHPKVDAIKAAQASIPPDPAFPPFFPITLQPNDRVVFAGDSITAYGIQPGGWVWLLNRWIQAQNPTANISIMGSGVPGNTAAQLDARLATDVLSQAPTVVVIFIGVNDAPPLTPNSAGLAFETYPQFQATMFDIIHKCQACPSVRSVILCTLMCYGECYDGQNQWDRAIDLIWQQQVAIAVAAQIPLIDLRQAYLHYDYILNWVDAPYDIYTYDRVHPNANGANFIADCMLMALGQ